MKNNDSNPMIKLSEFIVDRRKGIFVVFVIAMIYCLVSISRVEVEGDLTKYLPEDTETRQGVDIMDGEFETFGTARVMIANITFENALRVMRVLEEIEGIRTVSFYDPEDSSYDQEPIEDYYNNSAALYTLMFEEEEDSDLSQRAIAQVREYVKDYDSYVYTTVDVDDSAELVNDIKFILVLVFFVICAVLIFTSTTYAEVPIFILTFVVAAILNKGTNYIFGSISYISNAVDVILQLGLAIDYAIILFHRFMEERDKGLCDRDAMVQSLSKAIVEIFSSSLTTMAGLIALVFMHYQLGRDLGLVLCKAIIFSMLTVFMFMPFLIMSFSKSIDKTRHRSFVPKINLWGRAVYITRFIFPALFIVSLVFAFRWSNQCPYIFDKNSARGKLMTDFMAAKTRIDRDFETGTNMAIILPKGDYEAEAEIVEKLDNLDYVVDIIALAYVNVGDENEYVLTDELNPREFAEVADLDVGVSKLLYSAYAQDKGAYGAFIDGIDEYRIPVLDLIDFIYDEKEKGAFNLSAKQSDDINDIHDDIKSARKALEGETYSRIIFTLGGEIEGEETFARVEEIRNTAQEFYKQRIFVVGDSTADQELSATFSMDNTLISLLTAFFVGMILLFTFQSASLPFMLLITIQGSVWINFSIPFLTASPIFFICYLIVSAIQMGATIDYAIVITSRYTVLRTEMPDRQSAMIQSLTEAFPTILTSGTILASCGFLIGNFTANAVISQLGMALGKGVLISIALVMIILPQLLVIFDPIIDRTSFKINTGVSLGGSGELFKFRSEKTVVNGYVDGYFSGYISGQFKGELNGDMDFTLKQGKLPGEDTRTYEDRDAGGRPDGTTGGEAEKTASDEAVGEAEKTASDEAVVEAEKTASDGKVSAEEKTALYGSVVEAGKTAEEMSADTDRDTAGERHRRRKSKGGSEGRKSALKAGKEARDEK